MIRVTRDNVCYVLPGMCYAFCGAVVHDALPLSNLPGTGFDGVSCTHHTYYLD